MSSLRRPIFVVGCPRSGTSLLAVMLDSHPDVAVPPETAFLGPVAWLYGSSEVVRRRFFDVVTADRITRNPAFGTMRALVQNMVTGVTAGFSKTLEIVGTGYRAQMEGKKLVLQLGFSHPIVFDPPPGITIKVENPTKLVVSGADKALVGQAAADIRGFRRPEPYKGKGVRYEGEYIRRKAGKAAGTTSS